MKTFLFIVIIFLLWFAYQLGQSNRHIKETERYLDNCVKSGGKVEKIGNWWSSEWLLCYPKEK
jgi:hypothetical protein